MQAWFRSSLRPIYRSPLFEGADRDMVQRQTSLALAEHELVWQQGGTDAALYRAGSGSLSFLVLRYGAAVRIEPGQLQGFVLFQVPLAGQARIRLRARTLHASPGAGVVISPGMDVGLDWGADCTQLLVKMPSQRLEGICRGLIDDELHAPVQFDPEMPLRGAAGLGWLHQVAAHLGWSDGPGGPLLSPRLLAAQEDALLQHLLLSQASNYSERLWRPVKAASPRSVRAAERFIEAHLDAPLTLQEIALASGASVRSLCLAFQQTLHCSPMAYVRAARLARAREDLVGAVPGTQVTQVALRWGFNHLGRFSAAYRSRYGESPLATLKAR